MLTGFCVLGLITAPLYLITSDAFHFQAWINLPKMYNLQIFKYIYSIPTLSCNTIKELVS